MLQRTIMGLVHGAEAALPPDPVGAELKRIVPKPDELGSHRTWGFLEELGACLELEHQYDLSSVIHAEIPAQYRTTQVRRRPASASVATRARPERSLTAFGKIDMTFPQAFKDVGGGGMRITCSRMEPWAIGQMPRAPQTCEVPGPGFYVDRSLQRAICNPNTGEFAPAGKLRTCCALNTVSVATRFGEIDESRPTSAAQRRLGRPASAPCLGGVKGRLNSKESTWEKLLERGTVPSNED